MGVLIRVIAYNLVWVACVWGAAKGNEWIGPLVALVTVAGHIGASQHRLSESKLIALLAVIGLVIDSALMHAGILQFIDAGFLVPLWFAALWPAFATLLNTALTWLRGRTLLAVVFGAIGGPLAYYSGAKLGALQLNENLWLALTVIAIEWAAVTPLAIWLAHRRDGKAVSEPNHVDSTDAPDASSRVALEGGR